MVHFPSIQCFGLKVRVKIRYLCLLMDFRTLGIEVVDVRAY